jgi:hypothetical protein
MFSYLLLALVVGVVIRTMSRQGHGSSDKELTEMRERMLRLEQSVETMSADIERFSEGQRFLTALLEDRAKGQPATRQALGPPAVQPPAPLSPSVPPPAPSPPAPPPAASPPAAPPLVFPPEG